MASLRRMVNRRSFLKLGAAASGVVVGGCGTPEAPAKPSSDFELGYRPLGNTERNALYSFSFAIVDLNVFQIKQLAPQFQGMLGLRPCFALFPPVNPAQFPCRSSVLQFCYICS